MRWSDLDNHDRFGFAELDADGVITRCTRSFATLIGTDRAGVIGKTVLNLVINKDDLDLRFEKIKKQDINFASIRVSFDCGVNHSHCVLEVIAVPHPSGGVAKMWAVICRDDTGNNEDLIDELESKVESLMADLVELAKLVAAKPQNMTIHNITGDDANVVNADNVKGDGIKHQRKE